MWLDDVSSCLISHFHLIRCLLVQFYPSRNIFYPFPRVGVGGNEYMGVDDPGILSLLSILE